MECCWSNCNICVSKYRRVYDLSIHANGYDRGAITTATRRYHYQIGCFS